MGDLFNSDQNTMANDTYHNGDIDILESKGDIEPTYIQLNRDVLLLGAELKMLSLQPNDLNKCQCHVYEIITNHLYNLLSGKNPDQLQMILYSEGRTGKFKVIHAVTDVFIKVGKLLISIVSTGIVIL